MSIFDKFSLRGKVAIVTGGNRGVGKAIARGFAEAGAAVAIVARDEKKSEATLAELRGLDARHGFFSTPRLSSRTGSAGRF